ncbi:MAG: hypothetical protein HFH52_06910 [Lachnospiraceae bacterium]|nr:hypothetical protein [Lachnospiraceae bacterium]
MAKIIIIFSMTALLLAGGCGSPGPENILLEESMQNDGAVTGNASRENPSPGKNSSETSSAQAKKPTEGQVPEQEEHALYVQVSGAVKSPGVYRLAEGSRIFQAVELAGGLLEQAEADKINQAECLKDGQMIYIPAAGEEEPEDSFGESRNEDGRVNLNTATEAELMALPGIGAAKAGSILDWREKNGGFGQIEDLMKVEGIKDGVFAKIKDSVKVD